MGEKKVKTRRLSGGQKACLSLFIPVCALEYVWCRKEAHLESCGGGEKGTIKKIPRPLSGAWKRQIRKFMTIGQWISFLCKSRNFPDPNPYEGDIRKLGNREIICRLFHLYFLIVGLYLQFSYTGYMRDDEHGEFFLALRRVSVTDMDWSLTR